MDYNCLINRSLIIQTMAAQGYLAPLPIAMPKAMKTGSDRFVIAFDGHSVFRMKKVRWKLWTLSETITRRDYGL